MIPSDRLVTEAWHHLQNNADGHVCVQAASGSVVRTGKGGVGMFEDRLACSFDDRLYMRNKKYGIINSATASRSACDFGERVGAKEAEVRYMGAYNR